MALGSLSLLPGGRPLATARGGSALGEPGEPGDSGAKRTELSARGDLGKEPGEERAKREGSRPPLL